ncbi:hypothetical protein [Halodesulfovibrio spirochaetisodalis]|uniref:Uncharacterized protein n=1 Tax=Halodesulfovibrio spirochaetisodalis TaxID=1560234 RepID=A0A1B7XMR9_9BACT|nr:hypothetical protein [Halodesulfovibrio spirochaetisodalis]OBQ56801.1 hypothetical protein SP90_01625 [Halodesulfovibrio spirochaetisodalis]
MKKLLFVFLFSVVALPVFAADFVSPINFTPTDESKRAVIEYIRQNVKQEYSKIGMDSESTLRMMEKENLVAFKKLVTANDTELLARVIDQYCRIGMCNYVTLQMMYEQEVKAKGESLKW